MAKFTLILLKEKKQHFTISSTETVMRVWVVIWLSWKRKRPKWHIRPVKLFANHILDIFRLILKHLWDRKMLSCLFKTTPHENASTNRIIPQINNLKNQKTQISALPLCLLMKSIILCSPSPGTLASDKKTCRTKYLFINYIPQQYKNSIRGLITVESYDLLWYCAIQGHWWVCLRRNIANIWPNYPWTRFPKHKTGKLLITFDKNIKTRIEILKSLNCKRKIIVRWKYRCQ